MELNGDDDGSRRRERGQISTERETRDLGERETVVPTERDGGSDGERDGGSDGERDGGFYGERETMHLDGERRMIFTVEKKETID
ncbi:hypothetical protein Bca4012_076453 [Brassica carinata]|uniref:Uncharacterized protein n=1 Tax=Brassica carinata TaxID=52824 RepID=A0A8X7U7N9_BRACI|nr:hypothetical protein Bca52824_073185 [Brassica carinata]